MKKYVSFFLILGVIVVAHIFVIKLFFKSGKDEKSGKDDKKQTVEAAGSLENKLNSTGKSADAPTKIKVRYAETDQMGYVHHSHYALYLEEARMDLLKTMGIDYAQLEKDGIIMPVVEMRTRYSSPLRFGDSIVVEAEIALLQAVNASG